MQIIKNMYDHDIHMEEISIGYILYYPSINSINRIINLANYGYKIYLIINSYLDKIVINDLEKKQLIKILSVGINIGLSRGLKKLTEQAKNDGYKAILYFDQDTIYSTTTLKYISTYFSYIKKINDVYKMVACTTFRDKTKINKRYNHISTIKSSEYKIEEVFFTINSGSLYFLETINNFTFFDEKFFVDGVDYAFCINAKYHNYKITEIYNTPELDHESEQKMISIGGLKGQVYPVNRIFDFLKSHFILILYSLKISCIKPKIYILRSILLYVYGQLMLRLLKKQEKDKS
jgi:rhamnosyltransferase